MKNNVYSSGSALILTVVLTSMLAIVGILFVMMARVEKVATSAISENRELDLAIETVVAKISQQLVSDIPGIAGHEYYDYPDANNAWLASVEPELFNDMGTLDPNDDVYVWRQISDVTGFLRNRPFPFATQFVNVNPSGSQDVIREYSPIILDPNGQLDRGLLDDGRLYNEWRGQLADADGDGIADSKWVELDDVSSGKGKTVYAAVRVVDPEAMINVNTALRFNPTDPCSIHIDGSSQMQINLAGLAKPVDDINEIDTARCGAVVPVSASLDWRAYQQDVIWRTGIPAGDYWPFDISDELELRYRYCITSKAQTRLESVWDNTIGLQSLLSFKDEPYAGGAFGTIVEWREAVTDPNVLNTCRRHLLTTYNMDRIIDSKGGKMINVNEVDNLVGTPHERYSPLFLDMNMPVHVLYDRLLSSIDPGLVGPLRQEIETRFAQLAVNMVDFADEDDKDLDGIFDVNDGNSVSTLLDVNGIIHYGFEAQPFINEIAWRIGPNPPVTANFFALELCNPFDKDIDLGNFVLEFVSRDGAKTYSITFPYIPSDRIIEAHGYYVIVNQAGRFTIYTDPNTPTKVVVDPDLRFFEDWLTVDKSKPPIDRRPNPDKSKPPIPEGWGTIYDVSLKRDVFVPVPGTMLYVDNQIIDSNLALPGTAQAFGRDDRDWRVIYQTLAEDSAYGGSLGMANYRHIPFELPAYPKHLYSYFLPNPLDPPARLITVGDAPRILTLGHGIIPNSSIGRQLMAYELLELSTAVDQEHNVRLDLQNPLHRNVFQYLTVFDPNSDNIDNDADGLTDEGDGSEWKVPGRININTAPWYVLAQLPWVSAHTPSYELARAIIAYRNKAALAGGPDYTARPGGPGFGSIGELNFVLAALNNFNIGFYAFDAIDLPGFPDLTTADDDPPYAVPDVGDEVVDDFEERDVIFSRISNLVTVRSDVFTAYILVRIGVDGPQKRAIAILDRSGVNRMNVGLPAGRVRIVSLHNVPDPR